MFENLKDTGNKLKKDPIGWVVELFLKKLAYAIILAIGVGIYEFIDIFDLNKLDIFHQAIFGFLILISLIFFLFLGSVSKYALTTKREKEHFRHLIEAYGIKGFFPYSDKNKRQQDWSNLVKYLETSSPQNLNILALNGWDTFGCETAPLHNFLKNYQGELRILLIDPDCEESELRRSGLNLPNEKFKQDYQKTKRFCEDLKANNVDIELKLYQQKPIWKMITTESYMWLQHYDKFTHVDENPVYELYKDKNKTSLFFPLFEVFRKRWNHDNNIITELNNNKI